LGQKDEKKLEKGKVRSLVNKFTKAERAQVRGGKKPPSRVLMRCKTRAGVVN